LSVWQMAIFVILALGSLLWCWQYFRVRSFSVQA
jgi:hypothetical protein